jgi:hypothetical protein
MNFNSLILEASQELIKQIDSFYNKVSNNKEFKKYGYLRMREVYVTKVGYIMQFHLKPKYAKLENTDNEIKYIIKLLRENVKKFNKNAKVKRENVINNQVVIKIIFNEDNIQGEI